LGLSSEGSDTSIKEDHLLYKMGRIYWTKSQWIDRYSKKHDRIGLQDERLRGEKGAVALAARQRIMRAPARVIEKYPMHIAMSRSD
jgi:hypothetical protein